MVVDQRHDRPDAHAVPVRLNFQTAAKLPYALSHAGHTDAQGVPCRRACHPQKRAPLRAKDGETPPIGAAFGASPLPTREAKPLSP